MQVDREVSVSVVGHEDDSESVLTCTVIDSKAPPAWFNEIWSNANSPLLQLINPKSPPAWLRAIWADIGTGKTQLHMLPPHIQKLRLNMAPSPPPAPAPKTNVERDVEKDKQQCIDAVLMTIIHEIKHTKWVDVSKPMPRWYISMMTDPNSEYAKYVDINKPPPWLSAAWKAGRACFPSHLLPPLSRQGRVFNDAAQVFHDSLCCLEKDIKVIIPTIGSKQGSKDYMVKIVGERKIMLGKMTDLYHRLNACMDSYVAEQIRLSSAIDAIDADPAYKNECEKLAADELKMISEACTMPAPPHEPSPVEKIAKGMHLVLQQSGVKMTEAQFKAVEAVSAILEGIDKDLKDNEKAQAVCQTPEAKIRPQSSTPGSSSASSNATNSTYVVVDEPFDSALPTGDPKRMRIEQENTGTSQSVALVDDYFEGATDYDAIRSGNTDSELDEGGDDDMNGAAAAVPSTSEEELLKKPNEKLTKAEKKKKRKQRAKELAIASKTPPSKVIKGDK